ncbi:MAG: ABC transporter ATP-binding protein [Erysipelotrichaceae bacterium]|nr:ABC transporter ATP-binding protein [Erysipelotrichaceae bacterium]
MSEKTNVKLPFFGIPKIIPYAKKYQKRIISMVTMGIVASLIDSIFPLFNRYAIDHFIGEQTLDTIGIFVVLFLLVLAVQVVLNYVSLYWAGKTEMDVDRDLRDASFNHLQELSFAYFNQNNVGYIHARVMSDTGKIGELVAWRLMDIVWNGSYLLFVFAVMLGINARLTMYIAALVPVAVIAVSYFQKHLVTLNRRIREINSKITSNFNEGITGAKSIKTLVVEETIGNDFRKDTLDMRRTSVHATRYSAVFSATWTMMSSIALALILWQGGRLNMEGILQIGTLSVFMSYALGMMEPITMIIETIAALIAIQVNIERFTRLMETESDVADSPEVIEKYGDTFNPKTENWEPLEGDVEFRDVSFMYPDGNEMVLEHFNLKVPKGTNIAIVGETGAGKSTLVNLVCRFFEPTEGQVLIDGRDARERSQLWLHSNIGYVLQTPHLFSGTVRDNLRYGKPDASDEEIMKALDLVSARSVLEKMDKGLDSEVGEGGDLLSTGEKQLLSFARAILADPRILVLDEATASIDTLTEKAIQDAIATVIKGRTSFVIAHRLSTIVDADEILVVKDGKIIERGTHKELMRKKGYYFDLYTRQYEEMIVNTVTA